MRLVLNSVENSRKSLGRVIREYERGGIDAVKSRNLAYLFSVYLQAFKFEKDMEMEARLEALEAKAKKI